MLTSKARHGSLAPFSFVMVLSVVVSTSVSPHFSASHEIRGPAFKRRTMYSLLYWMERILFVDSNYQTIITQYLDLTKE